MLGETQWLWLLALVAGPLILVVLLARSMRQTDERHQNDPEGVARTERATRDLYEEEEHRGETTIEETRPDDMEESRRRQELAVQRSLGGRVR